MNARRMLCALVALTAAAVPGVAAGREVVEGDTLWGLVNARYGVNATPEVLCGVAALNEIENPNLIHPGEEVRMPWRRYLPETSGDSCFGAPVAESAGTEPTPVPVDSPTESPADPPLEYDEEPDTSWGQCSEWMSTALSVGWTESEWETLNWIMARESGCNPGAQNPSGASGLLQIMPMWADDCGGGSLFDPWFNLSCGLHVYHAQGWSAWSVY